MVLLAFGGFRRGEVEPLLVVKPRVHRSTLYGANMPYMLRLIGSGVAIQPAFQAVSVFKHAAARSAMCDNLAENRTLGISALVPRTSRREQAALALQLHHQVVVAKRCSRAKATDYMVETTGFARGRAQREIDRYAVWPGQACSYKVGHTEWVRLREAAKARAGSRFDLKTFHDVLQQGSMPMVVLAKEIEARFPVP